MNFSNSFYNTFIKPAIELDNQMTKLRTLCNISESKNEEILDEIKEIAESYCCTTADVIEDISSGLKCGYDIDYIIEQIRNRRPIVKQQKEEQRMSNYLKPPIGVSPTWYVIPKRIKELSEALVRYSEHYGQYHAVMQDEEENFKLMRRWAMELAMLCEVHIENRRIYKEDCDLK